MYTLKLKIIHYLCKKKDMEYIKNYEGHYSVTTDGKVYSHKSKIYLKQGLSTSGYLQVSLCVNGKPKRKDVHRLIAENYIKNPLNKKCVNHKDGNKLNNNVENLEWNTHSENSIHANRNGLTPPPPSWLGKFGYNHNKSKEVHQYNATTLKIIKSFGSANLAEKQMKYGAGKISSAIKNKTKTRDNYYYSYNFHPHFELY